MAGSIGTRKWWVNLRPAGLPGRLVSLAIKTSCNLIFVGYNYSYRNEIGKVNKMASKFHHIMSRDELNARFAMTASLDPAFATRERRFYETRTEAELRAIAAQAWNCNDASNYRMAKSYLALMGA